MKTALRNTLTIGAGAAAIVGFFALPANAASASSASSYYDVYGAKCRSYVRVDDWTKGKVRVSSTVSCNKKMIQINVHAILMKGSRGKTLSDHWAHCGLQSVHCSSYSYTKNKSGRQSYCGVTVALVNDSFTTKGAKVCFTV